MILTFIRASIKIKKTNPRGRGVEVLMKINLTDAAKAELEAVLSRYAENPKAFRIFVKGYS